MKGRVNTGGGGGLNASVILVIAPTGSTVTCTKGGTTKTAVEKNGLWTFRGIESGEWTVRATKGGQSTSQPVNVTQFDVYRVTLAYFNATIVTTFPTDCTSVTCKKDAVTLSVPSGSLSSGSYTFKSPEVGEWTLYATNGTKEKTVTVTVTEETEYSAKLNFELVILDGAETPVNWKYYVSGGVSDVRPSSSGLSVGKNGNDARLFTATKIDLTEYNTLTFYMTAATGETTYGVSPSLNEYGYPDSFSAQTKTSDAVTQIDVDITNIQSAYVMVFTHYSNPRTIQKIIAI